MPLRMTLVFCVMVLAGCSGLGRGGEKPPETVEVASRSVVIGGPTGYCVDRGASRLVGESPFVLLGSCASIAGDRSAGTPARLGVLTASVSAPGGPSFAETLPQLETFFRSPPGRAALARDGNDLSVTVLSAEAQGDVLIVHLNDTSANVVPGIASEYWRALFEVNGRLVTLSVMSFDEAPMGPDASQRTIRRFIERIRRESPAIAS